MIAQRRWVIDTNTLISHLLLSGSVPARSVSKALESGDLLVSDATLTELATVLARPKFNKYLSIDDRKIFFTLLSRVAIRIETLREITACRDPKDDKFLTVAVSGSADAIISGDEDLLILHPFLGIPIMTPKGFLEGFLDA